MEGRFRNAFRKCFPALLPYLSGVFLITLILLFPNLHWSVRLILILIMIVLAFIVLGLVFKEIQTQQANSEDTFIPLEPLPELDVADES